MILLVDVVYKFHNVPQAFWMDFKKKEEEKNAY